jgi:uncharacterized protein
MPPFVQSLCVPARVLEKAEAYAGTRTIDPGLLQAALSPDMFALSRQAQLAGEFAKGAPARLAEPQVASWSDGEATIGALRQPISKTLADVQSFQAGQIDGSEELEGLIKIAGGPVVFKGQAYLAQFVLPNFFFHATASCAILRRNGREVGKRDFLGQVPGLAA